MNVTSAINFQKYISKLIPKVLSISFNIPQSLKFCKFLDTP